MPGLKTHFVAPAFLVCSVWLLPVAQLSAETVEAPDVEVVLVAAVTAAELSSLATTAIVTSSTRHAPSNATPTVRQVVAMMQQVFAAQVYVGIRAAVSQTLAQVAVIMRSAMVTTQLPVAVGPRFLPPTALAVNLRHLVLSKPLQNQAVAPAV